MLKDPIVVHEILVTQFVDNPCIVFEPFAELKALEFEMEQLVGKMSPSHDLDRPLDKFPTSVHRLGRFQIDFDCGVGAIAVAHVLNL